jgi:hypothetical protein
MDHGTIRCPSAKCEEGAELLGVVGSDGRTAYLPAGLVVDEAFVQVAAEGRTPEKRFRFANTCAESGCRQWTGERCGVIDRVLALVPDPPAEPLPKCFVRRQCRWFAQSGRAACAVCSYVVTSVGSPQA